MYERMTPDPRDATMAKTKQREPEAAVCQHFQHAADLLGKRWNTQIIRALLSGETRFTDVRDGISSLSDALLSERLKELEAEGIVTRTVTPTTPVRIEYGLTEKGKDLADVMDELAAWAERWASTSSS
jgi:DNA-binding HxlR family transcriptional regulator